MMPSTGKMSNVAILTNITNMTSQFAGITILTSGKNEMICRQCTIPQTILSAPDISGFITKLNMTAVEAATKRDFAVESRASVD